ncbi:MAG: PEGA domain-containing protein [Fibromonadaceae bacterium]|jgi:uncharacterized protein (TIGR02145 family)|nr:PEGA domain-containing protein [Fibromonadaceae bacterium]
MKKAIVFLFLALAAYGQPFTGGISNLQNSDSPEMDYEKRYVVNLTSEPTGAVLSFGGTPDARCPKTPCKIEFAEGSVHIVADLEQYETADTTVLIKQNNQNINIVLKQNFGYLEIKPAYSEGIGKDEQWNLTISDVAVSSLENRLSPNKYSAKLSHKCYEDISFDVNISNNKREIFNMASYINLKKGGLILKAEQVGEPVSEPVFVNGKHAGETPFGGSIPLCSRIEISNDKIKVNVELKHNEKIEHKVFNIGKPFTDARNGRIYRTLKMPDGKTWFAENLNYKIGNSACYQNEELDCKKCGRLYDWATAKTACPKGWHLPTDAEWSNLEKAIGSSGWSGNGSNGVDKHGFSALACGYRGTDSNFGSYGLNAYFWSATEYGASIAYGRYLYGGSSYMLRMLKHNSGKASLFSVRCMQD